MTTWGTELEREVERLRAEVAAWRAKAAALSRRTDTEFTSVSGREVESLYTPLDLPPDPQAGSRILPLNGSMISTMRRTIEVGVKYSPPFCPSALANLPRKYS